MTNALVSSASQPLVSSVSIKVEKSVRHVSPKLSNLHRDRGSTHGSTYCHEAETMLFFRYCYSLLLIVCACVLGIFWVRETLCENPVEKNRWKESVYGCFLSCVCVCVCVWVSACMRLRIEVWWVLCRPLVITRINKQTQEEDINSRKTVLWSQSQKKQSARAESNSRAVETMESHFLWEDRFSMGSKVAIIPTQMWRSDCKFSGGQDSPYKVLQEEVTQSRDKQLHVGVRGSIPLITLAYMSSQAHVLQPTHV